MYTETFNDKYTILVGRTQEQNQALVSRTKKMRNGMSSPHGVLIDNTKHTATKYDKDAIIRAAGLVKQFSKESIKSLRAITVEYIPIKYVETTDVPGQVHLKKSPNKIVI